MRFLVIIFFSFTFEAYSQNNLTEEYINLGQKDWKKQDMLLILIMQIN